MSKIKAGNTAYEMIAAYQPARLNILNIRFNLKKMIIRIFKVTVPLKLHSEFEIKFKEISAPLVENQKGFISSEIARPSKWNPKEFIMISRWKEEIDLINFVGDDWNEVHIPEGMEKYVEQCSVSHYISIQS